MNRNCFLVSLMILLAFAFSYGAAAQTLPAFKMQLTDGKIFSSSDVSHQRPLVLIYFAPDCGHCQVLMNALFKKISTFNKAEVLMVTFESPGALKAFEQQYHTDRYPNIKTGIEIPVFFIRKYYRLEHTPFTALFDKNGRLVVSYKEYTPLDDLVSRLKRLK